MQLRPSDSWDSLWADFNVFRARVRASRTRNVNVKSLRESAKALVQSYFRVVRQQLIDLGVDSAVVGELDAPMHDLLRLANGLNSRRSYDKTLEAIRRCKPTLDVRREMLIGGAEQQSDARTAPTELETRIIATLGQLLPSAAQSYQQVLLDINGPRRVSYRGTAVELRECLRELLDHLAPDAAVMKSPGFAFEKGLTKPTMKQKARFILKNRGGAHAGVTSAQDAVVRVEEGTAMLARSLYTRGSVSTHTATTLREVRELKLYADAVLAELLEILGT